MGLFGKSPHKAAASPGLFRKSNKSKKEPSALAEADSSNEYSEPFDLLQLTNQHKIETRTTLNKALFKSTTTTTAAEAYLDDDSAYSSSYISQSISSTSPKASKANPGRPKTKQDNFDNEEDTLVMDSYLSHSSSSNSSSPLSPLFGRRSPLQASQTRVASTLPSKAKQCLISKASLLPILSEYESVSDSLLKNMTTPEAEGKSGAVEGVRPAADKEAFKNTIRAFEKMSTRCEMLESSLEILDEISAKPSK